jgi:hypothetical protein
MLSNQNAHEPERNWSGASSPHGHTLPLLAITLQVLDTLGGISPSQAAELGGEFNADELQRFAIELREFCTGLSPQSAALMAELLRSALPHQPV